MLFRFVPLAVSRGRYALVSGGRVRHPLDSKKHFVRISKDRGDFMLHKSTLVIGLFQQRIQALLSPLQKSHTCVLAEETAEPLSFANVPYACRVLCALRPTQSIMYVPLLVNTFGKIIFVIVQYKYFKSCSEDFMLQNRILCTRSCGTAFISQHC